MNAFYTDYAERLATQVAAMQKTLNGLPDAALDWAPADGMNSLAVLATHTAGSTRFWIGDVAGRDFSGRVRAEEFKVSDISVAELDQLLSAMLAHSQQMLAGLTAEEWTDTRQIPGQSRVVSVGWALLHALEHIAEHVGHAQITRELWDRQAN